MPKLKTFTLFFLLSFFLLASNSSALAETVTFTTYYPTPFGVYQELRARKMAIGDTYYDSSAHCWSGCAFPDIDINADLVVEGRVGIGTMTPTESLEIVGGKLKVGDTIIDNNEIYRLNNDTLTLGATTTFAVESVPNFTAPLMWDGDDPSFFVDPSGTSILNIIDLGGVERSTWPVEGWKLVTCHGVDAADHCTPSCGGGWTLKSNIEIWSIDHWIHLGLCRQN